MKTQDKIILALICFSMLTVMVNSSARENTIGKTAMLLDSGSLGENIGIGELIAETIEEPELNATAENIEIGEEVKQTTTQAGQPFVTKEYLTSNGLMLTLGSIYNYAGSEKNETVHILMDNKLIGFSISIEPYSTWNFAKIDGVLIVPVTSALIDPYSTSFYPSGEELVIKINSTALHELEIYTGSKGAPSIIIPKVPISWTYDADKKIVTISSRAVIKGDIVLFWVGFSDGDGTIFLEDRQRIETFEHMIGIVSEERKGLENDLVVGREKLISLQSENTSLGLQIKQVTSENEAVKINIANYNKTVSKLEDMITANVALSPSLAIVWAIVALILIILLIDVFMFRPKSGVEK